MKLGKDGWPSDIEVIRARDREIKQLKATIAAKDAEIAELRKDDLTEAMVNAPRALLMIYGSRGLSVGEVRRHCVSCGDNIDCWPEWAKTEDKEHLTKAGAAILIYTMMRDALRKEMI